ncbi:methyl-accepting chemotaxis protein [Verminephrobacter aporrectodeae subsp. tuberculatae]|uniref:Methyl-accepting chemotaxis protein n=1 Tax=Verminephrobacter aporrectodeae subsp. tuberculatae TaxID=1110392 RepID=A0ABT3KS36_9BURK|nr:hypothetical protein [Verminephrobacter aporrectodeae]MCW5321126.1 methyl-accepting chemotaxis protein [Verminephrobacter aporrectodeae subsp. tuberculatae]MCW8164834.1 methyl-accepting chemotaxis protein [Verminephrobacter aporrectodeae subsp. tuberculatae]MCW8169134.1 methyl-accepting chemotaxis protein [Verminephrobacter aporrectodeae subsp. tuberculatae]MCW8208261.1 methyl-accepting chemotaxis protein [Verminephrobacter aporrectodeae subsp. tuberculatae]
MKSMMGFLEKAGLVRAIDGGGGADGAPAETTDFQVDPAPEVLPVSKEPMAPVEEQIALSLPDVYAAAGVPVSVYPAEKLLRLVNGLKELPQATVRAAVAAVDESDDTWSIEDPIRDAHFKIQALAAHANALRAGIEQADAETLDRITAVKAREEATVADIRAQITRLEELMGREIARSIQEQADLGAALSSKREAANRLIEQTVVTGNEFKLLVAPFQRSAAPAAAEDPAPPKPSAAA